MKLTYITCKFCGKQNEIESSQIDDAVNERVEKALDEQAKKFSEEKDNAVKLAISENREKSALEYAKLQSEYQKQKIELENQKKISLQDKELALFEKDKVIEQLNNQIKNNEISQKLAIKNEVADYEKKIVELTGQLEKKETEYQLQEKSLKEKYDFNIQQLTDELERVKDFHSRQSTKMTGESLEHVVFNDLEEHQDCYPNARYWKDNDVVDGTKADFGFEERTEDDVQLISITIEAKNQEETSGKKKKNSDHYKKLNDDRTKKGCEWAILVSTLEPDNPYFNRGIVFVREYEKMVVVRPQFLIPAILFLRNIAMQNLQSKRQLIQYQQQERDFTNFENNIELFKTGFTKYFKLSIDRNNDVISSIKKAINNLQKTLEFLETENGHLLKCEGHVEDLSVQSLTHDAPSIRQLIEDQR